MPTECNPTLFEFAPVAGRAVVAAFDGGRITSDAGSLLLGATDRAIRLVDRFAACFTDRRCSELIEHEVSTLIGQRVFGIALGYEDLNDHDQLRHDPMMAILAGKLEARRAEAAKNVPTDALRQYDRMSIKYPGDAMAALECHEDDHETISCGACFISLLHKFVSVSPSSTGGCNETAIGCHRRAERARL